ncbi:MAG: hypothetical protein JW744_03780 [Candidatus Diapherotrites archaeon]|uniref:Uncharacterized protein n=1 Tax=Candidatus Iainarchaeum sp. TaxID=3101447 RepID=A0A939C4U3_9ARCH|nr:hypothetical protein [Candidatus Diapherotrites archaeon]
MQMVNRKGQEAAPFELLIAVIVMGFVIVIGTYAINNMHWEQCKRDTEKGLNNLKNSLESITTAGSVANINFRLSGCFDPNDEIIWIEDETGVERCVALGAGSKPLCPILKYANKDFSLRVPLNIPASTVFPSEPGLKCPERPGTYLVDFEDKEMEKQGDYLLINGSSGNEAITTICAYRRES